MGTPWQRADGGAVAMVSMHASPVGSLGRAHNGGMNLAVRVLCETLAGLGVPTDVFVRRDHPGSPNEEMIAPTSRLVRLPVGPSRELGPGEQVALVPEFAQRLAQHAASEQRRYRVVHSHYWLSGMVAEHLRERWDRPWIHSFHSLAATRLAAGLETDPRRVPVEQRLANAADRLVAMSAAEAHDLVTHYGADPHRICVVSPGVHLRDYAPRATGRLRAELGLEGRRVVLYAGRLEPLKGADLLVEALARLALDPDLDDVVTLVVGDNTDDALDGGERSHLEALVRARGLEERVCFIGAVAHDQLADYYALADVCVVPSHTETFGLVALEAQASGTPVVAAAVGGLPEVLVDGVTGFVAPRTPVAFAERIAALLRDPLLRGQMGQSGRLRAAGFSWSRSAQRLVSIYDRVNQPAGSRAGCGELPEAV